MLILRKKFIYCFRCGSQLLTDEEALGFGDENWALVMDSGADQWFVDKGRQRWGYAEDEDGQESKLFNRRVVMRMSENLGFWLYWVVLTVRFLQINVCTCVWMPYPFLFWFNFMPQIFLCGSTYIHIPHALHIYILQMHKSNICICLQ